MTHAHFPYPLVVLLLMAGTSPASELNRCVAVIRAVGPQGKGHREATEALSRLVQVEVAELPKLLAAMDGANPLAANWFRAAAETVAERAVRRGELLPASDLERFVLERDHSPRARRLAYELLIGQDPEAERRLISGMMDDPSLELRRDAVAKVIEEAEAALKNNDRDRAVAAFRRAMPAARDEDQIRLVSAELRKLGEEVDLRQLMGFLVDWKLVGPFDNTDGHGYDSAYPPERTIDLAASHDGKHGKVEWIDYTTTDEYGKVDLNSGLVEEKEVVAYAVADFHGSRQQTAELRITSYNAVKVWVNGQSVIERKVYHGGSQLDQYVGEAALREGRNVILVKVCQNAQTQDWARFWGFQLRVCDAVGSPILSTDRQN
jgi:hypothetical protein